MLLSVNFSIADIEPIPKKVLILHTDEEFIPANIDINKALVGRLKSSEHFALTIYSEYMDAHRYYDASQIDQYKSNFLERYTKLEPDIVIAVDFKAFSFLRTNLTL